jgi:threonine efflux protein
MFELDIPSLLSQLIIPHALMLVVPGPNALVVLRSSLDRSRVMPIAAAFGIASGAAIAAGLAAWSAGTLPHSNMLRVLSTVIFAGFLLRTALHLSTGSIVPNGADGPMRSRSLREAFLLGLAAAMFNRTSVPYFIAFFVGHACTPPTAALACLAIFVMAGSWFMFLGLTFARVRTVSWPPLCSRAARWVVCATLITVASRTLWTVIES